MKDFFKAMKLYKTTLKEEVEELANSEPGINEEQRVRMATRVAVKICKTYLKREMRCSDLEADEFIKEVQS